MVLHQVDRYTIEDFESFADSPENVTRLLELVDGEIVEKVPTEEHGRIVMNIAGPLWVYVRQYPDGRVVLETRHRVTTDAHNARIPDISYIQGMRPAVKQGSVPQMPDLAVEVQSPEQSLKGLREKVRYLLANGSRLVWLVLPDKEIIEVYTPDDEMILSKDDVLTGGAVLPGFSLPLREIFADPINP